MWSRPENWENFRKETQNTSSIIKWDALMGREKEKRTEKKRQKNNVANPIELCWHKESQEKIIRKYPHLM